MAKEMLINVSEGEECRIALLENGKLEELYMERTSSTSHVGNIYKGRVTNVEASIQAAFVDFGLGRNGFLHISDLLPSYFGRKGDDVQESVGRKMARRDRPPIQRCLRRGDEIVVQIIKEGIGTKGPTLSTYLSIPGRILVMMPGMANKGVSKKIEDDAERRRLRQILDSLKPIDDVGFIIRTAGIGKTKTEIQRDLTYLTRLWQNIEKKRESTAAPVELYTEGDLITRSVRDVFTSDVDRIIVDNKDVAKRIKEFIKITAPRTKNKVELHEEPVPLFHAFGIEKEIELMYSRHVPLPSGGSLVIDSTEAIVAIDVNSGKFRDHSDAEMTAFKTDMEAADEIPRQLRLRDLGGVIICDFIDLRFERHRRQLEERLHDNLRNDRAKTKVLRMSQFGIIEMTRQRMRPSLKRSIYFDCPHCHGSGLVKTPESMSLDVMRRLAIAVNDARVSRVDLAVCGDVSFFLLNRKRTQLATLEQQSGKKILVRSDPALGLDDIKLDLYDTRDGLVYLEALGMRPAEELQGRGGRGPQGGRGGSRGRGGRDRFPNNRDRQNQPRRNQPAAPTDDREDREAREERYEQGADEEVDTRPVEGVEAGEGIAESPAESTIGDAPAVLGGDDDSDGVDTGEDDAVETADRAPEGDEPRESREDRPRPPQQQSHRPQQQQPHRRQPHLTQYQLRQQQKQQEQRGGGGGGDQRPPQPHQPKQEHQPNRPPQHQQPRPQPQAGGTPHFTHQEPKDGPGGRRGRRRGGRGRGRGGGTPLGGVFEQHKQHQSTYGNRAVPDKDEPGRPLSLAEQLRGLAVPGEEYEDDDQDRSQRPAPQAPPPPRQQPPQAPVGAPANGSAAPAPGETGEAPPKRRRRRRGGRGRRKRSATATGGESAVAAGESAASDSAEDSHGDEEMDTETRVRVPEPQAPVVRTGSTDRHLVSDEPIAPEPVRRPRTYRDLDEIPDDLD